MPDSPVVPGARIPERPLPHPEVVPTPEGQVEKSLSRERVPEVAAVEPVLPTTPVTPVSVTPVVASPALRHQVEAVLAEGLEGTYKELDQATQEKLKLAGEETAGKISILLQTAKVQAKKIVELIVAWLRIIPGVSSFFLEQEAKIKADKILALRQPPPH